MEVVDTEDRDLGCHGGASLLVFELEHLSSDSTADSPFSLQIIHPTQLMLL